MASRNLLTNGSFEDGAAGWVHGVGEAGPGTYSAVDTTVAADGQASLHCVVTDADADGGPGWRWNVYQQVAGDLAGVEEVTFQFESRGTGPMALRPVIVCYSDSAQLGVVRGDYTIPRTSVWQRRSLTAAVPDGTTKINAAVHGRTTEPGTGGALWIDTCTLLAFRPTPTRRLFLAATIAGIDTPVRSVRTTHDVDQPVGTGTITLATPRPAHVQPNAPITIQAGYDGAGNVIFRGTLSDDDASFSERGGELSIELEGPSAALKWENAENIGYYGPMSLNVWWRSMCNWAGVSHYHADATTDPDGAVLMRGDNSDIGPFLPISTDSTPLSDMARLARLFGYRHFDTPLGARLQRVSGFPPKGYQELPHYVEGDSVMAVSRGQTLHGMVNYWDVYGAAYTAADGHEVAIRSFPAVIQRDDRLGPRGVSHDEIRDADLDTVALADACRHSHEIDYSTPQHRFRWTCVGGDSDYMPGDQVAVQSATVNRDTYDTTGDLLATLPRPLWVMRVEHDISDRGWSTTMEGWAGAGSFLPAGDDCTTQTLLSGARHLGTEYLGHYRRPSPDGTTVTLNFTLPDAYSTLTVYCDAHGSNSFQFNEESEASRFEVWQGGERVASGELPKLPENLEQQLDYDQDRYWDPVVIPLSGSLDAGSAELRIIAGEDSDVGDTDDYEIKNVRLTTCGVGAPEVIGG